MKKVLVQTTAVGQFTVEEICDSFERMAGYLFAIAIEPAANEPPTEVLSFWSTDEVHLLQAPSGHKTALVSMNRPVAAIRGLLNELGDMGITIDVCGDTDVDGGPALDSLLLANSVVDQFEEA